MNENTPINANAPVMLAWEAYKATDEYDNTRRWASKPDHTDGSLWAAFFKGYFSGCANALADSGAGETFDKMHDRITKLEQTLRNLRDPISIAANYYSKKPGSERARSKLKAALDVIRKA